MRKLAATLLAATVGLGAPAVPVLAQETEDALNPLCSFHGEGCDAHPSEWTWNRQEARIGVFSVELPCDETQANAFGQLVARTPGAFEAAATRSCMKNSAGFMATMIGFADLPEGEVPPKMEQLLAGHPDIFSAFKAEIMKDGDFPEILIDGRRALVNDIENEDGYSRVAIIEVSPTAVLLLTADINDDLAVPREEGDALIERFFNSLEFIG